MKKQIAFRALLGFPLGVFIGYTITIIISTIFANGFYSPVVPELVRQAGSEINAVWIQYGLAGILGSVISAGSLIWEIERWNIMKQTIVHFILVSVTMLPIAYLAKWVAATPLSLLSYFGAFAGLYFLIWLGMYLVLRNKIKKANQKIQAKDE